MTFDITKELEKTFQEAVMRHEARSLKTPEDWARANAVKEDGEKERAAFEEKYRDEYDSRVEIVRKRLIKEAGALGLDHPVPKSRDRFDGEAIKRQAHREVQRDHDRVLQQSRDNEAAKLLALQKEARERERSPSVAQNPIKEQFRAVSDRRTGHDRRAPVRSR